MTRPIYVDHQAIESAAVRLGQHHETFVTLLADLERDLAPLLQTWSGGARDLYAEKQQQWHAAANDLAQLLGSIATLTKGAHGAYSRTVDDLTQLWT